MQRCCAQVEAVGPGERAELDEALAEEGRILKRLVHFGAGHYEWGEIVNAPRAVGKRSSNRVLPFFSMAASLIIVGSRNPAQRLQCLGASPILLQLGAMVETPLPDQRQRLVWQVALELEPSAMDIKASWPW